MLRVSGRWLPVALSLLTAAGVNAFAAESEGSGPVPKVASYPAVESAARSVETSLRVGSENASTLLRADAALLPIAPGSLGVVWTSPTSGRLLWLIAAAYLLTCSQGWRAVTPRLLRRCHAEGHPQPPRAAVTALLESQIPTCMIVCQQAMRKMNDKRDLNRAQALVVRTRLSDPLESRPASTLRPPLFFSSLLEFAQSGRGPPPVS